MVWFDETSAAIQGRPRCHPFSPSQIGGKEQTLHCLGRRAAHRYHNLRPASQPDADGSCRYPPLVTVGIGSPSTATPLQFAARGPIRRFTYAPAPTLPGSLQRVKTVTLSSHSICLITLLGIIPPGWQKNKDFFPTRIPVQLECITLRRHDAHEPENLITGTGVIQVVLVATGNKHIGSGLDRVVFAFVYDNALTLQDEHPV